MEHKLFTELRTSKAKIIYILENYDYCRDDDSKLYANYVALELGDGFKMRGVEILNKMQGTELLTRIANHEFINYASLIRCRRLIQADETYKHLRGEKYEERLEADDYFRNNIHNL
jgi:hypothetical protein